MLLKNNRIPKYFALLLFCFELFAPVLISAEQWVGKDYGRKTLHEKSSTYLLFSTLVSEEAGSEEERDSKVHNRCFFNLLCSTAKSLNYLSLLLEKVAFSKDFIHNPVITIERLYSHFGVFRI